ncbi:HEAT repeat-containing protein 6 [Liparis tanakae]|uniref:HEAT repeat-containing protein 6 n=1 Tax=Liparis tanakae TaxID=230148 RepID=A0A4Z2HCA5_9TELE|nr:HEAT repeat-containing protein 6 [Liparis tanakae]
MMAAHIGSSAPGSTSRSDDPVFPPVSLSAEAAPFTPLAPDSWRLGGSSPDVEKQFSRCAAKLRALRSDSSQLREQLNLLLDQLLSENYNKTLEPNTNIRPEDMCSLLKHHLRELLGEDGVLLRYSSPSQPNVELRRVALTCMANICLRIPGQAPLDDQYRSVSFRVFLKTVHSPKPPDTDELFYCMVIQAALKGLQCCLSGGKWKFVGEDLGSILAALKRLMFQGTPGVNVEWPTVLYPAPLPQYEGLPAPKPAEAPQSSEPPKDAAGSGKTSGNKKRKSRGKEKKASSEESRVDDEEDVGCETVPSPQKGGGREGGRGEGETSSKASGPSLYPSWKRASSDSEFSDPEGSAQSKLRLYNARIRQAALHCLLAVVKGLEKRTLYGYWSSLIPDSPIGGPPPLTLITIILKDPSPKVRACALQVLSAMLDGSRQFLAVAEDTASPRKSFTPFSFLLAAAVRELHRALTLALLAETSHQTLTQVIKCLAHLVANAPYHRLRPGLLSPLWKQMRPYVRHRDVNVRVSVLTLYGALVTTQAPLPEIQLLLRQPESSGGGGGLFTPQDSVLSWRQRDGEATPPAPPKPPQRGSQAHSPHGLRTPEEADAAPPWLLQLCVALVTQPRDDQSDGEGTAAGVGAALEPSPVRLEALQLLEELGTVIIQQYRAENNMPEGSRVPMSQVVLFWSDVLSGPLNAALQSEQHPTLQTSACDTLSSILPQAFAQLPDKTQMMCITVLLGLTYSENYLVKTAAVRALGVYILFPCLREDVMFVADTANTILAALDDRSPNVRAKAAWSLGNLTDALIVKSNAVRALGNLLHFLRESQLTRSAFQRPLEDAVLALVKTVQSEATMKVRWNACYALGNAFRNPALPLGKRLVRWFCTCVALGSRCQPGFKDVKKKMNTLLVSFCGM